MKHTQKLRQITQPVSGRLANGEFSLESKTAFSDKVGQII